jgi:hypothetical protein
MKRAWIRLTGVAACLIAATILPGSIALAGDKEDYEAKSKQNDATIGVIAGVIDYLCPKIAPAGTEFCKGTDPVAKAVALANYIDEGKPVQNRQAADLFFDAVEQFKQHIPVREKAKAYAKSGDYKNAVGYEEFAYQYLVKTATQGLAAKNRVDGA